MLIASKFEEIYAPEVNDFVFITDNAYTSQEILDMEVFIFPFYPSFCYLKAQFTNSKHNSVTKKMCIDSSNRMKVLRYIHGAKYSLKVKTNDAKCFITECTFIRVTVANHF